LGGAVYSVCELILVEQEVRVCYDQRVVEDMVVVSIDLEDNLY